jgi:lysozyme
MMKTHFQLVVQMTMSMLLAVLVPTRAEEDIPRSLRTPSQSQIEDLVTGLGATSPNDVRPLVPLAPNLIMAFEGWEPSPYDDPSGYCTVGYGHLLKKSKCASIDLAKYSKPLTKKEGEELLESDTRTARAAVQHLVKRELKDNEFGALSSFVFNVGKDQFADSTLLELVNEGHFNAASKEFGKWIVSKKKVLPGLVARRACEAALFKDQVQPNAAGEFVRSDCEKLGAAPETGTLIDIETGQAVQLRR